MATKRKPLVRSKAFVERQVTFYSFDAQLILLGFARLTYAMYSLGIALRAYAPPEKVTALTDSLYEELVTPLEQEIADDLSKLQAECKKQKVEPISSYTHPIHKKLRIIYPKALRILALAQNLDTLVCRLNDLWFAGLVHDEKFFALRKKYSDTLLDIANRIKSLATEKLEEAKAEVAAKEQARARKSQAAEPDAAAGEASAAVIPLAAAGQ